MPAARYWRIARIETFAGGDLELSEVALYEGATRVDGSATVSSVVAPVSGVLSDLGDASFSTSARWAGDAVRLPGFAIEFDFGSGNTADVTSVGVAGPTQATFAHKFALEYSDTGNDWTRLYATVMASKWPGASALFTLDATAANADLRGFVIAHYGGSVQVSAYQFDGGSAALLPSVVPQPQQVVNASALGLSISPDGSLVAVICDGAPRFAVYGRSGRAFTKVFDGRAIGISSLPANCVAFSPEGSYMAIGLSVRIVVVLKITNGIITELPALASLPPSAPSAVAFSPDGVYLAAAHSSSPYVTIYKRSGDTFTKLPNPASLPPSSGQAVAFSPDGVYLAVGCSASPYVTIYKRSGDTFTKLPNPASLPTASVGHLAFSPDGEHLAVSYSSGVRFMAYSRSGDTFTAISVPSNITWNQVNGAAYSPDSAHMVVCGTSSAARPLALYSRSGDTYTQLSDPPAYPGSTGMAAAWLPFTASGAGTEPANFDPTPSRVAVCSEGVILGEDVAGATQLSLAPPPMALDIYDAGRGRIVGTVKEKNTPANTPLMRRVVLLAMPGSRAMRETWSDPVTGVYEFNEVAMDRVYAAVSYDHTGVYRGVVADNLTPEVMP